MTDDADTLWRPAVSKPLDIDRFYPISAALALEIAGASVCGVSRAYNTDHYLVLRTGRLQETLITSLSAADLPPRFEEYAFGLVVADGFGKEGAGTRASRVALSALAHLSIQYGKWNVRIDHDMSSSVIEQAGFFIRRMHDAVLRAGWENLHLADMAVSLTALYIAGSDLFFAHVGHTRGYLLRGGAFTQLTGDHTLRRQRARTGAPTAVENGKTDFTHVVTETLGGRRTGPDVDIEHIMLSPGDRLLLCTNGLTDVVPDDWIADVLALHRRPCEDCQRLIDLARAVPNRDDVTVLVADYTVRSDR